MATASHTPCFAVPTVTTERMLGPNSPGCAARPGEFGPDIRSVITVGSARHGVWEAVAMAQYRITSHGGALQSGSL